MEDKIQAIEAFKMRTKKFCLNAILLSKNIPKTMEGTIIARQFLRSATSVAANYRAVCRARSEAEKFSKMCIVVEEADESLFWLELIIESGLSISDEVIKLKNEAEEIVKITNSSRHKLKIKN